jgi:F0F1-type ATP synthase delta subunit
MEKIYADALKRSVAKGGDEDTLVTNLLAHLKAEGRMKLLPGILRELRSMQVREDKLAPVLEIANEKEKSTATKEAKEAGVETTYVVVNDRLISGWRARSGSALIDRSGKQALIDIYKNIVRN